MVISRIGVRVCEFSEEVGGGGGGGERAEESLQFGRECGQFTLSSNMLRHGLG